MIGRIIKILRKQSGLSQKELGKLLNLSDTTISAYELGKISPDFEIILKILRLFDHDLCILDVDNNVIGIESFLTKNEY